MKDGRLRVLAICVFQRAGRILVLQGHDSVKNEDFFRPLGGKIEFGERGANAVRRELKEETGIEVGAVRYLGTLESIFEFDGAPRHEIVLVYDGEFTHSEFYEQPIPRIDEQNRATEWKDLEDFAPGAAVPLYPDGLYQLLRGSP